MSVTNIGYKSEEEPFGIELRYLDRFDRNRIKGVFKREIGVPPAK
jgi:hypothetical protein